MKRIIVLVLFLFAFVFSAENSLTSIVNENTGGLDAYKFVGTNTAAANYFVIAPSQGYFNADDQSDVITFRFSSSETTLDSVRWDIAYQGKIRATDTWFTIHTFTNDSALTALNVINASTYGKFPIVRFLMTGGAANNALQTVTGQVTFDKD